MRTRRARVNRPPVRLNVQAEIDQLRAIVALVQHESAGHLRRCAEMQVEIDMLKKRITESQRA